MWYNLSEVRNWKNLLDLLEFTVVKEKVEA
jgi:hypothetical protein